MFNRRASSAKSRPEEILEALNLQPGQHIADIGVGGGYFSLKFAEAVGDNGIVYAVDTNQGFLGLLLENAGKKGLRNIRAVPVQQIESLIPEGTLDCVFLRNVFHHLEDRIQYFKELSNLLKENGRVAIVEYSGAHGFSFHKLFGHHVSREKIVEEMTEAGYVEVTHFDFLPEQSFTVFKRKSKAYQPAYYYVFDKGDALCVVCCLPG